MHPPTLPHEVTHTHTHLTHTIMATRINNRSIAQAFMDYNTFIGETAYNPTYIAMVEGDIERTAAEQEQAEFEARAIEEQDAIEMPIIDAPKPKAKPRKMLTEKPRMDKATLWAKNPNIRCRAGVAGSDLNPARGIYLNYLKESNHSSIWRLKRFWREATTEQRNDALAALGAKHIDIERKIAKWEQKIAKQKANK